ncbi:MAG: DUF4296 domain-containing protein [Candidatus Cyclonatronum sp.]|uniref:DUF4296 domain-containing protein n=1 Tax=Cyclonatronum sp. TaxID=3024185 RepID=UPI0025C01FA3|nr:DUF4296 domain-containing protein [Cyclonatronum sp.]MCC5932795.1 DUF4296 domain-containing protein [Balneolales bacterium]MCH8485986.1 DUF4296 domain-containing protein [Cyclonatronum sp.]
MFFERIKLKAAGFLILTFVLLGGLAACNQQPDDLIPEEIYIDLLVEFELINFLYGTEADSLAQREFLNLLFNSYNISPDQFDRSHAWYERDIDAQIQRKRRAVDRINEAYGQVHSRSREQVD